MLIRSARELPNYNSFQQYIKFVKSNFRLTGKVYGGRFYTFNYKFALDYPYKELKYYDFFPFVFSFDLWDEGFVGINMHHLAVYGRLLWWHKLIQNARSLRDELSYIDITNKRLYKVPGINYPKVWQVMKKSKIGIRKYRWDRMSDIREIPLYQVEELCEYICRTYFGVSYKSILSRYITYRP